MKIFNHHFREGDMDVETAAAFAAENMKTIFAYALHRVSEREDAEDLAGDIVLAVLENAGKLKNDSAFHGWFWAVAANTVKKYYRKKSRMAVEITVEDTADDMEDMADMLILREETALLRRELALLAKEFRECTVAYYFDGLSCSEIAKRRGISVEMVKYYLYKTRRILKEGMTMTREYGERSYKPADFYFGTIFQGAYNAEYRNLFSRKLPGNILYCAYYTPMTLRELSVELGVSAVYLEDEIALLEKYDLLTETGGKYQTKLCVFTKDYDTEFFHKAEARFTGRLGGILASVKEKLCRIREVGFAGCGMEDNRLLWAFLFKLMQEGHNNWENRCGIEYPANLYAGAKGVNYAVDYDEPDWDYASGSFAGYYGLQQGVAACFADFGVLESKNYVNCSDNWTRLQVLVNESIAGGVNAPLVYLQDAEMGKIFREILAEEADDMAELYRELAELAVEVMKAHAPAAVAGEVTAVIQSVLFHRSVGLMGKMAVDSGELCLPDAADTLPTAVLLYNTGDTQVGVLTGDCGDGTR